MPETTYRERRAVSIENQSVRVTVTVEGGHIAEIVHKPTGVNPLWSPIWPSIEPSAYDPAKHPGYGGDAESRLLAGILGHNLCMDIFGGPSEEEAAAGLTVHGEASVVPYRIHAAEDRLTAMASFPWSQLEFQRDLRLSGDGKTILITERVRNTTATDRPIGWTQHVTLGPPFLERGSTQFRASATRSKVFEEDFSDGKGYMQIGAEFEWPNVPRIGGGFVDLRVYTSAEVSAGFTTHLMDPRRPQAFFMAFSPRTKVLCGYIWKPSDFPWLGIWEENHCRQHAPWNGKSLTRGMEFGASPMPESRRRMIERNGLFGVPGFRWIPAKTEVRVDYCAFITTAGAIPDEVVQDGETIRVS